ncbi:MAG: HD domain-containing protein [Planctomycetaceae bacterium]|jgi:HD superfamily phosphohydrolase|nr:HD domain-containing protein [Planctomycetaceae bacterium]
MKNYFSGENLSQDPVHGYIPFSSAGGGFAASACPPAFSGEVFERDIIDSPWVQRLRQIHQLQTAWLVYPSAEHTRFQHSLGAMHLASKMLQQLYPSLADVCAEQGETLPGKPYLESLVRMAALLHDIGHGPFGHFFDARYLSQFSINGLPLNHERLGAEIIRRELAPLLGRIRRNPNGILAETETLDPEQICFLIVRPAKKEEGKTENGKLWLKLLRSLFSGLYTADNMDFVLRDAFMTGYSTKAFDLDRLLHYSFFTKHGLTIHQRGFAALTRFLSVRAELFRSVYFHRTVRAMDIALGALFAESKDLFFPGNPLEHLAEYRHFTEWSLLVDVSRWDISPSARKRDLAPAWHDFLQRKIPLHPAAETTAVFNAGDREQTSVFADEDSFRRAIAAHLPESMRSVPFEVDIARHLHRPDAHRPAAWQNFLYEPVTEKIRLLEEEELFRHIPQSYRICRIYTQYAEQIAPLAAALDALTHTGSEDDETNM